ncbi:MAG: Rpn family recombination-promoting nuclease/putative transposase [Ruminococcus sp.]|jgi:predicted transposase/invertase (TIGR01784 family)|nr:Rpn family recombination-promoting nuclease/putative transposase [Ruminococcus sp.]
MEINEILLPEILPAYEDGIFKAIFTRPESEVALIDIIRTFTGVKAKSIVIKNNERTIQNADDKRIRFDISCTAENGELIDIEMQASAMDGDSSLNSHRSIKERAVFYEAMLHSSQIRPKSYDEQKKSIQLMICNYNIFPDDKIIRRFNFKDQDGNILSDSMNIIFAELSKLDVSKPLENMDDLEEWAFYLRYSGNPKYKELIESLKMQKEAFRMAYETQNIVSHDQFERARYMSRLKFELDQEHNQHIWERQGIQIGEYQKALAIAKSLRLMNLPTEMIIKATGLTEEEIQNI